jgi:hypothetical protein
MSPGSLLDPTRLTTLPARRPGRCVWPGRARGGQVLRAGQRSVARDAFDAANYFGLPGLLDDEAFRLCFVCQIAGSRRPSGVGFGVSSRRSDRRQQLLPMLRLGRPHVVGRRFASEDARSRLPVWDRLAAWRPADIGSSVVARRWRRRRRALHPGPVIRDRIGTSPCCGGRPRTCEHRRRT